MKATGGPDFPGGSGDTVGPERRQVTRPYDPERGLRGVMSGLLILEAVTVLLAIPVAEKTGGGAGPVGVTLIAALAVAHIAACAVVARPFAFSLIAALQGLMIAGWVISASLGVMGIVFALVWAVIFYFRVEFRRRQAAGTLPSQTLEQRGAGNGAGNGATAEGAEPGTEA